VNKQQTEGVNMSRGSDFFKAYKKGKGKKK